MYIVVELERYFLPIGFAPNSASFLLAKNVKLIFWGKLSSVRIWIIFFSKSKFALFDVVAHSCKGLGRIEMLGFAFSKIGCKPKQEPDGTTSFA